MYNIIVDAGVAQLVVHLIRNQKVTCSSHATSSITHLVYAKWVFFAKNPLSFLITKLVSDYEWEILRLTAEAGLTRQSILLSDLHKTVKT